MDEDGGFLVVETKFGNIIVEQSYGQTSVKFIPMPKEFCPRPTHIEDQSYGEIRILSMVKDDE